KVEQRGRLPCVLQGGVPELGRGAFGVLRQFALQLLPFQRPDDVQSHGSADPAAQLCEYEQSSRAARIEFKQSCDAPEHRRQVVRQFGFQNFSSELTERRAWKRSRGG